MAVGRDGVRYVEFKKRESCATMSSIPNAGHVNQPERKAEWLARLRQSCAAFDHLERHITSLWDARGVPEITYERNQHRQSGRIHRKGASE